MSWNPLLPPGADAPDSPDGIETVIVPRARDLGGFEVRRALPAPQRQLVGPFIFFDQMGPAEFVTGQGIDVRPHPHIGLGTVTWILHGALHHRDSLGSDLVIEPGAVNWMVAGRGVTHSERTPAADRAGPSRLLGVQTWVALPERHEETAPAFEHHPAAALPRLSAEGIEATVILGRLWGETAPATLYSEAFHADVRLAPGARLPLPDDHEDRGAYVLRGTVQVAGQGFEAGRMMVFRPGDRISLTAGPQGAHLLLLGGATLDGPRHIWWNFVSASRERIEAARADWRAMNRDRFALPPSDRDSFIPDPG